MPLGLLRTIILALNFLVWYGAYEAFNYLVG